MSFICLLPGAPTRLVTSRVQSQEGGLCVLPWAQNKPLLEWRLAWGCLLNEGPERTSRGTMGSDWETSGSQSPRSIQKEGESVGQARWEGLKAPAGDHSPPSWWVGVQRSAAQESALARTPYLLRSPSAQPGFLLRRKQKRIISTQSLAGRMLHQGVAAVSCPQATAQTGLDVQMRRGPLCLLGQGLDPSIAPAYPRAAAPKP